MAKVTRPDLARLTVSLVNTLLAATPDRAGCETARALQALGEATGFDRTLLLELRADGTCTGTQEWVAPGVEPATRRWQQLDAQLLGPWLEAGSRDECIEVPQLADLDPKHPAREALLAQGIASLLLVPMLQDGKLLGFLACAAQAAPRGAEPGEVFLLRCVANALAALLARCRAAADLQATLVEQARAEARFQDVAAISRSWVWEQDADLRFTYISDSFRLVSGVDPARVIGRTRDELIANRAEVRDTADWKSLSERLAAREPFSGFVYRTATGPGTRGPLWVQISGRPILDADGRFAGYRGAGTDVTELRHALARAEDGGRAKSTFLARINQEIRGPLNGILGATDLMQGTVETPEAIEWLATIRESGESLARKLDDLLDVWSVETGTLRLREEAFDPGVLLGRLEPVYAVRARDRGLSFTMRVAPEAKGLRLGDAQRILQMLHHLLGNALKFTRQGTISVQLTAPRRDWLRFVVADSGPGMSADQLDRVWQPFDMADRDSDEGGCGLGLTIVRNVARLMGGMVTADATPGAGTRINLDLPLPSVEAPAVPAAAPEAAQEVPATAAADWSKLSVLVVDDHATNRLILKSMLASMKIRADIACDGHEALGLWKIRRHDLVLMDIAMPVMDGVRALDAIRRAAEQSGYGRPMLVAVTANALPPQIDQYRAAGFDRCLAKPVRLAELEAVVAEMAGKTA